MRSGNADHLHKPKFDPRGDDMSELVTTNERAARFQLALLGSVSALSLLGGAVFNTATAGEQHDPTIWIDVGGQFEMLSDPQDKWNPDYFSGANAGPLVGTFPNAQKPPRVGYDTNIGISFHPSDTDWFVSASAHFGRARRHVNDLKQDKIQTWIFGVNYPTNYGEKVYTTESHRLVDFKVGKDVGIGLPGIKSSISLGVRFANLRSRADAHISSNFVFPFPFYSYFIAGSVINRAHNLVSHEFAGVGPSVEWKGSLPIAGEPEGGQLAVDAGLNAAILFGRQTTDRTVDGYYWKRQWDWTQFAYASQIQNVHADTRRRRNVTVPNLGGFIGASYRLPNVKLSLGYRADMYFNAMDRGVSSFKSEDRGFFGPYFNLSVGLGG